MIQLTNTVGCVDTHTVCRLLPHAFSLSNIFLVFFFLLQNCQMNAIKFQYHANDHPLVSVACFTVVFTAVLARFHSLYSPSPIPPEFGMNKLCTSVLTLYAHSCCWGGRVQTTRGCTPKHAVSARRFSSRSESARSACHSTGSKPACC